MLNLESNSLLDLEQSIQLGTCPRLWSITLTANPVCRERCYRKRVVEAVPQLAMLDDENVTGLSDSSCAASRCTGQVPLRLLYTTVGV